MLVEITARQLDLQDEFKKNVEKKVSKLAKYFDRLIEARVVFSSEGHNRISEIVLHGSRIVLKAKGEAADERTAFDEALEKVERRLRKHKSRLIKKRDFPPAELAGLSTEGRTSLREMLSSGNDRSRMSVEDAIAEMDEKGLSFTVFVNSSTDRKNLIYRLEGGDYGLIEPEE